MWMKSPGDDVEAVQKVLGEPIFAGLSDRAWRARTQLYGVSIAAIALEKFGLHVNADATVFGFNLTDVSDAAIHRFVIAALIYLVLHFAWLSWENFLEWLLRLTGMRVAFVTVGQFSSAEGGYPSELSQSTLSNWWKGEAKRIGSSRGSSRICGRPPPSGSVRPRSDRRRHRFYPQDDLERWTRLPIRFACCANPISVRPSRRRCNAVAVISGSDFDSQRHRRQRGHTDYRAFAAQCRSLTPALGHF